MKMNNMELANVYADALSKIGEEMDKLNENK